MSDNALSTVGRPPRELAGVWLAINAYWALAAGIGLGASCALDNVKDGLLAAANLAVAATLVVVQYRAVTHPDRSGSFVIAWKKWFDFSQGIRTFIAWPITGLLLHWPIENENDRFWVMLCGLWVLLIGIPLLGLLIFEVTHPKSSTSTSHGCQTSA